MASARFVQAFTSAGVRVRVVPGPPRPRCHRYALSGCVLAIYSQAPGGVVIPVRHHTAGAKAIEHIFKCNPSIDQSGVCYPTKLSAGRKEMIRAMNKPEEIQPEAPQEPAPPSHDPANDPAMSSRRELSSGMPNMRWSRRRCWSLYRRRSDPQQAVEKHWQPDFRPAEI